MTTKITIDAHAGWPVEVDIVDKYPDQDSPTVRTETVPVNAVGVYFVHSSRSLVIREKAKED
jgi:hypothetical protein